MQKMTDFSKAFCLILFLLCINFTKSIGQLSNANFNGANVQYPNQISMDNYENQSSFVIHPDYHLSPKWVKAGAYFSYNGYRVNVESVQISVYLPKSGNNWGYREHNEYNVGEPDWSGWWHEPWENGFFIYTVKAKFNGYWYERSFEVHRNTIIELGIIAGKIGEFYIKSQSGGGGGR
jgi:hypothetical protein